MDALGFFADELRIEEYLRRSIATGAKLKPSLSFVGITEFSILQSMYHQEV